MNTVPQYAAPAFFVIATGAKGFRVTTHETQREAEQYADTIRGALNVYYVVIARALDYITVKG